MNLKTNIGNDAMLELKINHKTIHQFQEVGQAIGRENYFGSILALFEKTMQADLEQLRQAVKRDHMNRVRQLCHRMKSSAYTLGADHMGDCLSKMEVLAESPDEVSDQLSRMVNALFLSFPITLIELRSYC